MTPTRLASPRPGLALVALLALVAVLVAAACSDPDCPTAEGLQQRLDEAAPGAVVEVPACVVSGAFVVPAGVTLRGAGPGTVLSSGAGRAVTLATGAAGTAALTDLRVESAGCAAVVATGGGAARVERVEVGVGRGVGVALEGVTAELRDLTIEGPIAAADLSISMPALPPFECGGAAATHGLVVVDSPSLAIDRVAIGGFEAFGALLVRSSTTWNGGTVNDNLGVGLEVVGGSADLSDLELARASYGAAAIEAYDGIFIEGAVIASTRLSATGGTTYGLFHANGVRATHLDATVSGNGFAGVWSQGGGALTLVGATLDDNAFAGVATFDNPELRVERSTVSGTRESVGVFGLRTVMAADGLHLIRSAGQVQATELRANERVGLLLDLDGGSTDAYAFDSVLVEGSGSELGAIAQNGTVAPTWDAQIERLGDTLLNDMSVVAPLDIAGAVGPPCLPPLDAVGVSGIMSLVGPP